MFSSQKIARHAEHLIQNGEKYLIINFNSEIEEKDEY